MPDLRPENKGPEGERENSDHMSQMQGTVHKTHMNINDSRRSDRLFFKITA